MNDVLNGLFELFISILLVTNIVTLYRDKQIKGVNIIPTISLTVWGIWSLYFYYSIGYWMSFVGGLVIVIANTIWVGQMIYYSRKTPIKDVDFFAYEDF
ncbi:hypothetical protein M0R04_05665 [Candidatus Dojkabacteria bacterium]|jgi:hypothetical protein|nr:hypothetical protein [Candidatus Dojkabacteria bacterium]